MWLPTRTNKKLKKLNEEIIPLLLRLKESISYLTDRLEDTRERLGSLEKQMNKWEEIYKKNGNRKNSGLEKSKDGN